MNKTIQCRDENELTPMARKACELFLNECKKQGLDIFITETYRSQERQNWLYEQGRSRSGNIVTWTKKSRHTSRMAWDIACNGKDLYDTKIINKCGEIARKLGITWGGDWKQKDLPHFEVTADWKYKGVDEKMTEAERKEFMGYINKLGDRITKLEKPMVYNQIDKNMPEFARPTIQKLVDKKILKGDAGGLNLTYDTLRVLVMIDRTGTFD